MGYIEFFSARGIAVDDFGDVPGFRWSVDKANPRAMNASEVTTVAKATAERVASALRTFAEGLADALAASLRWTHT